MFTEPSLIINQTRETAQVSINCRMYKQSMEHSCYEILLGNKKEKTIGTHNTWMNLNNIIFSERRLPQKNTQYIFPFI